MLSKTDGMALILDQASYTIHNHPALLALSLLAPRDRHGNLLLFPKMDFNDLHNPLQGRYALLSQNRLTFTIVPQASLLFNPDRQLGKNVVQTEMPRGQFMPAFPFLEQEPAVFTIIRLVPNTKGGYEFPEQDGRKLLLANPDHILVFLDQTTGLPVAKPPRRL
jgi:hypothetical protein